MASLNQRTPFSCFPHTHATHSANGLFETKVKTLAQLTEGTANRVKAASAGKPLQSCEMAVFLKVRRKRARCCVSNPPPNQPIMYSWPRPQVLPVLETLSQTLVERLEERLTQHTATGADFQIGDIYLGQFTQSSIRSVSTHPPSN